MNDDKDTIDSNNNIESNYDKDTADNNVDNNNYDNDDKNNKNEITCIVLIIIIQG